MPSSAQKIQSFKVKPGSETRRTPRRIYQRPIGVLWRGRYFVVQAQQLSEGGLLFASDAQLHVKTQVVTSLILPGGRGVIARGELIYEKASSGGHRLWGVKFAPLSLQVRRSIRNYVTAKTQAEAEMELGENDPMG